MGEQKINMAKVSEDLKQSAIDGNVGFLESTIHNVEKDGGGISYDFFTKSIHDGESLLTLACSGSDKAHYVRRLFDIVQNDKTGKLLKEILQYKNKYEYSAVHMAIQNNNYNTFVYMMSPDVSGAIENAHPINRKIGQYNITALHMAAKAEKNAEKYCEVLLLKGADINAVDGLGRTPLFLALENGNFEAAKLLIAYKKKVESPEYNILDMNNENLRELEEIFPEYKLNKNLKALNSISARKIEYSLDLNYENKEGKNVLDFILESDFSKKQKVELLELCYSRGLAINKNNQYDFSIGYSKSLENTLLYNQEFLQAIKNDDGETLEKAIQHGSSILQSAYEPLSEDELIARKTEFHLATSRLSKEEIIAKIDSEDFSYSFVSNVFTEKNKKEIVSSLKKNEKLATDEDVSAIINAMKEKIAVLKEDEFNRRIQSKEGLPLFVLAFKECSFGTIQMLIDSTAYIGNFDLKENLKLIKKVALENNKLTENQFYTLCEHLLHAIDKNLKEREYYFADLNMQCNYEKEFNGQASYYFNKAYKVSEKYPYLFYIASGFFNIAQRVFEHIVCNLALDRIRSAGFGGASAGSMKEEEELSTEEPSISENLNTKVAEEEKEKQVLDAIKVIQQEKSSVIFSNSLTSPVKEPAKLKNSQKCIQLS